MSPEDFAVELGDSVIDPDLVAHAQWQQPDGRDYRVSPLPPALYNCRRAYFLKIAPGGSIHPHVDASASEAFETHLIVFSTNKQCRTYWQVENNTFSKHLELGKRYRMADRGVTHWATNNGDTDRIHLLIEYPK